MHSVNVHMKEDRLTGDRPPPTPKPTPPPRHDISIMSIQFCLPCTHAQGMGAHERGSHGGLAKGGAVERFVYSVVLLMAVCVSIGHML